MPTFPSKPVTRRGGPLASLVPRIRRHPVLFFGLPFVLTIVGASFGLSTLTQTRYDYNATKVRALSKEEEIRLRQDRKRIDIREEYFKLQAKGEDQDDWEPVRIARPAGTPEWGVAVAHAESRPPDKRAEEEAKVPPVPVAPKGGSKPVVLGPDGKPCRACNSKLAFSAALRGTANATATATAAAAPKSASAPECPPDGEELGRASWTLLHSAAAYFPTRPSDEQAAAMASLLRALPVVYPCHSCAEALAEEYAREAQHGGYEERALTLAQAVRSGPALRRWLCGIHNEVNARLGKPTFPCTEARLQARWLTGPTDGSCD